MLEKDPVEKYIAEKTDEVMRLRAQANNTEYRNRIYIELLELLSRYKALQSSNPALMQLAENIKLYGFDIVPADPEWSQLIHDKVLRPLNQTDIPIEWVKAGLFPTGEFLQALQDEHSENPAFENYHVLLECWLVSTRLHDLEGHNRGLSGLEDQTS